MELRSRVAIVTGGSAGIGRAICLALAGQGATVVVAARNRDRLEETVREIRGRGGAAAAHSVDLARHEQIEEMVRETRREHGRIDVLVSNAAVAGPTAAAADLSASDWEATLAVNLTGAMVCARHVLPCMIEQRRGSIVNIAARAGMHGFLMRSPYAASKGGLIALTRTLAMEVGGHGIRVNCISPGPVDGEHARRVITEKAEALGIPYEQLMREKTAGIAMGRFVRAEEVAELALFLASDRSSGITGQNIVIDGGVIRR